MGTSHEVLVRIPSCARWMVHEAHQGAGELMTESPFITIPSGIGIARYFWEETDHKNPGCNGIDLWRDDRDYCYLWVSAMVDLDLWEVYLLDVRTKLGRTEHRDYLYLFVGAGNRFEVEWHNQPILFDASNDAHRERFRTGMKWLTDRIEGSIERADS